MVTDRKGCGINHAVNGGFSHACGHCARANEAAATEPDAISSQINSSATVRLTEFAGGLVERIDLSRYGNNLGRVRTPMQDHYESAYASLTARTADHRSQPWIDSELGDVPVCIDHPLRAECKGQVWWGRGQEVWPPGVDHAHDPAVVGDTGDWPPLHVVEPGPLAHIQC